MSHINPKKKHKCKIINSLSITNAVKSFLLFSNPLEFMLSGILLSFFLWNSAKIKYSNNSVNEICNRVAYELILESVFIFGDRQL